MDFSLPPQIEDYRRRVRAFVEANILPLEADPAIGTGAFRLVCDGMEPPELDIDEEVVVQAPTEPLVVPVGPAREDEPTATPART